jgi:hypothetical protein
VETVKYPYVRSRVMNSLAVLADLEYQEQCWVRGERPPGRYESFDEDIHTLFDEDAAACAVLFDRLEEFDAAVPEGLEQRVVIVGAGGFEVLARLVGEFSELSDRSLEEVGATAADVKEFSSAVRSVPGESAVGLRIIAFGTGVRLDIDQLLFPPGTFELFRTLIDRVVAAHGERELSSARASTAPRSRQRSPYWIPCQRDRGLRRSGPCDGRRSSSRCSCRGKQPPAE